MPKVPVPAEFEPFLEAPNLAVLATRGIPCLTVLMGVERWHTYGDPVAAGAAPSPHKWTLTP